LLTVPSDTPARRATSFMLALSSVVLPVSGSAIPVARHPTDIENGSTRLKRVNTSADLKRAVPRHRLDEILLTSVRFQFIIRRRKIETFQ
jgi:hypothetical protein